MGRMLDMLRFGNTSPDGAEQRDPGKQRMLDYFGVTGYPEPLEPAHVFKALTERIRKLEAEVARLKGVAG